MSAIIWTSIGTAAALLTSFGFVPQVVKMWQRRSAGDVSLVTLGQFTCGVICWALYGWYLQDAVVVTANVVTLGTLILALALFFRFRSAPAGGILLSALHADALGGDVLAATRDGARAVVHSVAEAGGDVAEAARNAVAEALDGARARAVGVSPAAAARAAADGAREAAAALDAEKRRAVEEALAAAVPPETRPEPARA